jgi:hypothetical protein
LAPSASPYLLPVFPNDIRRNPKPHVGMPVLNPPNLQVQWGTQTKILVEINESHHMPSIDFLRKTTIYDR